MDVEYVYQELDVLPKGYEVPEGRVKPWGTGHAILCAAEAIDGAPFAVINSDDYYGRTAFEEIYRQLITEQDGATYQYAMVAYDLYKTPDRQWPRSPRHLHRRRPEPPCRHS